MESFIHLITSFGVLAILLVIFAESGLLIGFVLPGDSLLFTAGYMVQQNILHIDIHIFALLVFAAAVLGDSVGYSFGHKVGRKLFEKENSRFFKKKYLEQTEKFYDKHGSAPAVPARGSRHRAARCPRRRWLRRRRYRRTAAVKAASTPHPVPY